MTWIRTYILFPSTLLDPRVILLKRNLNTQAGVERRIRAGRVPHTCLETEVGIDGEQRSVNVSGLMCEQIVER